MNSAKNTMVEVYNFPGASNGQQAMGAIAEYINNMGMYCQYQSAGQASNFVLFRGTTMSDYGTLNWVGAFKKTGNGVAGITVGATEGVNAETTAQKILNTLQ